MARRLQVQTYKQIAKALDLTDTPPLRRKTGSSPIGYAQESTDNHHHCAEVPLTVLSFGGLSVQFEHTVLMTEHGPEPMTITKNGPQRGHKF